MKLTLRLYAKTICAIGTIFFLALPLFVVKQASAFSLGRIRVTGAPNEEFRAEIPVRTNGKQGLRVRFGDGADYGRVGLSRPAFLDNLMLEVAPHPVILNQSIIYITSSKPVFTPSFNLVIRAKLGGGIILESYFLALDFQKNLNLDLPVTSEERIEMEKIARELAKLRPGAEEPELKPEPEQEPSKADMIAMIEKIRNQERAAAREEDEIQSETIIEPDPVDDIKPVKVAPKPAPVVRKPKPARAQLDKVAMIERIRKHQQEQISKQEPRRSVIKQSVNRSPALAGQVIAISVDNPAANVYQVKKGDSLYKIAKKLGTARKDYDRVVVALWRDNFKHFIGGNIHGLYGGSKLDYSKVNETVKNISRAEAKRIINEQWPLWKSPVVVDPSKIRKIHASVGKPLIGIKAPPIKVPFKDEILSLLDGWKESFEKGDMVAHMEYYSDNYKNGDMTKQNLSEAKQGQGFGKGKIDGKFDDVKMTKLEDIIEVSLPTVTGSDKNIARMPRILYFAKENGRYRIVKETGVVEPATVKSGHPFIVHVASFKSQESAQMLVELLRKKSYNAFEVLSIVPGKGRWYRVAVDRFASISDADLFSLSIKQSGLSRYTRTLKLPYAIRIGDILNSDETPAKIDEYLKMGFSTYIIKEELNGKTSIFLGAFDSEKSAASALALLGKLKDFSSVARP